MWDLQAETKWMTLWAYRRCGTFIPISALIPSISKGIWKMSSASASVPDVICHLSFEDVHGCPWVLGRDVLRNRSTSGSKHSMKETDTFWVRTGAQCWWRKPLFFGPPFESDSARPTAFLICPQRVSAVFSALGYGRLFPWKNLSPQHLGDTSCGGCWSGKC